MTFQDTFHDRDGNKSGLIYIKVRIKLTAFNTDVLLEFKDI